MHRRCISTALAMSVWHRPAYGQCAAPASFVGSISPGAIERTCRAGLHGFTPSRMRLDTPAAPHSHSTAIWQDKSRDVRPGRTAEKVGDISILARCAFSRRNVQFPEMPVKSEATAHRVRSSQESAPWRVHGSFAGLALPVIVPATQGGRT
jgi:hypothetical protein